MISTRSSISTPRHCHCGSNRFSPPFGTAWSSTGTRRYPPDRQRGRAAFILVGVETSQKPRGEGVSAPQRHDVATDRCATVPAGDGAAESVGGLGRRARCRRYRGRQSHPRRGTHRRHAEPAARSRWSWHVFAFLRGDSMIDAAIRDGDIVVIRQQQEAHRRIVAAMLDGEATVRVSPPQRSCLSRATQPRLRRDRR